MIPARQSTPDALRIAAFPFPPFRSRRVAARPARLHPLLQRLLPILMLAMLLAPMPAARAHDIPADVTLQVIGRLDDGALRLVVRVPLKALRDVEMPLRGRGYLDLPRADAALREAAERWLPEAFVLQGPDGAIRTARIDALRASLESEKPFDAWAAALAHVQGPPLPPATEVPAEQVMLDALLTLPAPEPAAALVLLPRVDRLGLRVRTALRLDPGDGALRVWDLHGDPRPVPLSPSFGQVTRGFVESGIAHVLGGIDHLLFVLCLALPSRRFRSLLGVVTAFTVAHSITLIASAYGLAPDAPWFAPAVEWLIALSILWMALENALGLTGLAHRWALTFAFGLVHGFGFSFGLREELQFAGSHLLTALLAFNVGVELGQALALAVIVPVLAVVLGRLVPERAGIIAISALVGHTAWHWMAERWEPLSRVL